jgi:hypothetical protein
MSVLYTAYTRPRSIIVNIIFIYKYSCFSGTSKHVVRCNGRKKAIKRSTCSLHLVAQL